MAAPKGNKFAESCETSGRPRNFNLEEEAVKLYEWAKQEDSLVLRLFSAHRGYSSPDKMFEYCKMSDEFRKAYNMAKCIIGARREEWLMKGKGHPAPFNRYAALYDKELKDHDIEMVQKTTIQATPEQINKFDTIMKQIEEHHARVASSSDLNKADNNISKEQ